MYDKINYANLEMGRSFPFILFHIVAWCFENTFHLIHLYSYRRKRIKRGYFGCFPINEL